jgi:hypothetical protein
MAKTDTPTTNNEPLSVVNPEKHGKYNVKPLANNAGYNLWAIRVTAVLTELKEWDVDSQAPINTDSAKNFLISVIADDFLEQVLDTDLKAPTIWAYFKRTILVSTISAQSTALSALFAFNFGEPTMVNNLTAIKNLQRTLSTAFGNSESIPISDLVTLFALVNMPSEYASLRTTLEETKSKLNLEQLFRSLIREEASLHATVNRARASPANATCTHNREASTCWTCHPELRPVCSECQTSGSPRFNHSKDRCPKRHANSKANKALLLASSKLAVTN